MSTYISLLSFEVQNVYVHFLMRKFNPMMTYDFHLPKCTNKNNVDNCLLLFIFVYLSFFFFVNEIMYYVSCMQLNFDVLTQW